MNRHNIYVVFGASSGIGRQCALALNNEGATVVAVGRNLEKLLSAKAVAMHPESFHVEIKDLAEDIENLALYVRELREQYGKFSGMIYCAGISPLIPVRMWQYGDAKKVFEINYFAPISLLKGFSDKRNVVQDDVSCVLIASAAALLADKGHASYAGSKAALIASAKSMAKEVAGNRIRINCVSPTIVRTPMTMGDEDYIKTRECCYPLGVGEVEDVANMVMFLLSDKAKWITGQNYVVDCASF